MKKIFLLPIVTLMMMLFVSSGFAQPGDRGENRLEQTMTRIKEKVGLTDEQAVKVREIMKKAQEAMRAEFENSDGDREAMRAAMTKHMSKADSDIEKILTKAQKPKFEEYKKERQKEREQRMKERQG